METGRNTKVADNGESEAREIGDPGTLGGGGSGAGHAGIGDEATDDSGESCSMESSKALGEGVREGSMEGIA